MIKIAKSVFGMLMIIMIMEQNKNIASAGQHFLITVGGGNKQAGTRDP